MAATARVALVHCTEVMSGRSVMRSGNAAAIRAAVPGVVPARSPT